MIPLLVLIACGGPVANARGPVPVAAPEAPVPAPSVLDVVAAVAATQPLSVAAVEKAVGGTLTPAGANAFFSFYDGKNLGAFSAVEARIPAAGGAQKNGIVTLSVAKPSVTEADVGGRFGAPVDEVFVPNAQRVGDQPRYVRYPQAWGEIRLGFGIADGLLREIVLDGTSAK